MLVNEKLISCPLLYISHQNVVFYIDYKFTPICLYAQNKEFGVLGLHYDKLV